MALALPSISFAAVNIATESSTGTPFASTPWFGNMSATDLVNAGQTTLSLATITTPFFGPNGTNDGLAGPNNTTQNTYLSSGADLANSFTEAEGKSWATYDLDVSVNTLGYDITSIESFMGWQANSELHANQTYSVEVSTVGSGSYLALTSVSYVPFTSVNGADHESHVAITEDATGILATGVDSIRFKFDNPGGGAGGADGTVIREIDIHGAATSIGPDTTAPIVSSLSPADGASGVSLDSNLSITFNEGIKIGTGDITIKNLDAANETTIPVGDAQVSVMGRVLRVNPNADLAPNTNYAVQIAGTAIKDLSDNSFAGITNDTTWNFTTESTLFVVTTPVTRQVVQRDGADLGSIPVEGTVGGPTDRVEARAVAPPRYEKNLGAIWFIGDSITQSNADGDGNGSPRKSLYDLLVADESTFSFTGHFTANIDGLPTTGGTAASNLYHYHSGISGSVIGASGGRTNMTANIPGWWNSGRLASTRPDIVLIMLGTNDIDINADVANAPDRVKLLVDTILAQVGPGDPDPAIFVAQITPNTGSAAELQRVIDFNNALPTVIATLQGEGKDVTLVDQFTLINANTGGLLRDSLHTNSAGNDVLASQWFEAIKTRFATTSGATTTPWQTIATSPTGAYSGVLASVPAGGWYSVEVRTIVNESPVETTTINMVGVGDIYLTAGQSNSGNFGSPAATPADDRVVARASVTGNIWLPASDPMPIANGSGGSPWSRLGDLLSEAEDIPIGFINVGVGGTQVSQWVPGTSNYNNRLEPALQSFPVNGFRAVLWHQGESDSIANVTAAAHASRLNAMISQSRIDAGWNVPWYLAEASFHPTPSLASEEPVAAGQRATVHSDPNIFLGPSTDEFHLEDAAGGKLSDSVHFNAAGLIDHATQWRDILLGATSVSPRNGNFEDNRSPAITGLSALTDGALHIAATTGANDSPMVLDWRILSASGIEAADGGNGFHNPTTGTYAGAIDTTNNGVLPKMEGRHVALLDGGTAGNYFLQSYRTPTEADRIHTLTVALGVRDNPASFGGARLEITSNGSVVASGSFDKIALDAVRASDASGTFTDASISWTTGANVTANQLLAVRIIKEGGPGTVLDFDNVRFSAVTNDFANWIGGYELGGQNDFNDDPDGDLLSNGVEAWLGTHPGEFNQGLGVLTSDGLTTTFSHPQNATPPRNLSNSYEWSTNLVDWYAGDGLDGPGNGQTVTMTPNTVDTTTTVTTISNGEVKHLFLRMTVKLARRHEDTGKIGADGLGEGRLSDWEDEEGFGRTAGRTEVEPCLIDPAAGEVFYRWF